MRLVENGYITNLNFIMAEVIPALSKFYCEAIYDFKQPTQEASAGQFLELAKGEVV